MFFFLKVYYLKKSLFECMLFQKEQSPDYVPIPYLEHLLHLYLKQICILNFASTWTCSKDLQKFES